MVTEKGQDCFVWQRHEFIFVIENDNLVCKSVCILDFSDQSLRSVDKCHNIPEAPNNNGYLHDFTVVDDNTAFSKGGTILNGIIKRDLQRPFHNICCNDVQDGLYWTMLLHADVGMELTS